ncbi:MAG: ATP-grasp domain-containing protein [Candidatus Omnitrophica bacterium]|nr:ATP-grasp domain-containing protein [Candidatus Omnitrophota bacterium]
MKSKKVLLLFDSPYLVERGYNFKKEFSDFDWDTEREVYKALLSCGYQVKMLGLYNDIGILLEDIADFKPDIIFNLVEVFDQKSHLDKNVASVLEMLQIPYTGASPRSLLVCCDKGLTKTILNFHKIKAPQFHTFYRKRRVWLPKRLRTPLIVKPLSDEASRGLSQASIAEDEKSLVERIKFIHDSIGDDAIVEEYIEGREFYVSVLGTHRLKVLPLRELTFGKLPEDEPKIATYRAKWDYEYRKRWQLKNIFAKNLSSDLKKRIEKICKRAYRALNMKSYARFDIRVTQEGKIYILEANANPSLDPDDELAESAKKSGIKYKELIQKIVKFSTKR